MSIVEVRIAVALVALGTMSGCTPPEPGLSGQWRLELIADTISPRREGVAGYASGTVIFDRRIREHTGVPAPLLRPYVVGRYYVDLAEVSPFYDSRVGGDLNDTHELGGDELDLLFEILGTVEGDSVQMVAAPRIIGMNIRFAGFFHGDSVTGRWSFPGHHNSGFASGRFHMRRVPLGHERDSAIARSRRAAE
jgi:hypothetical protein